MAAQAYNMAAHIEARGINVQVLDYRWSAGEHISELEPDFILRWRPYPSQVSISGRLREGALKSFGQLMFFPADVPIETGTAHNTERTRNIICRFNRDWFNEISPLKSNWSYDDLDRCFDMNNIRIEQAIQRLGMEAACPGFASTLIVESLATVIAVEISRHFSVRNEVLRVRSRDGELLPADLHRIYEYIDSFTCKCPSIDDIAAICDISAAHLRRSFKKTTGQTVHQYVENVRLSKAKSFLADTDLPLKEISYRLGFADSSTFSSTFRKALGEAPSVYRYRSRI